MSLPPVPLCKPCVRSCGDGLAPKASSHGMRVLLVAARVSIECGASSTVAGPLQMFSHVADSQAIKRAREVEIKHVRRWVRDAQRERALLYGTTAAA